MAAGGDVDEALGERVWTMIVGFSGFGFPKAHGAAFGLLAYQSTWLRVHYGAEFLCSLLDEQPMGFYPPDALVHEAQRRGIEILPPDVNASEVGCTVTAEGGVRLGLGYVAGVRADEVDGARRRPSCRRPVPARSTTSPRAPAPGARRSSGWPGRARATRSPSPAPTPAPVRPASARRTALWRLGIAAPAYAAGDDTQLSLPVDLPQAPALAGGQRLGRDDRRLRDHRADRRPPSAAAAAPGPGRPRRGDERRPRRGCRTAAQVRVGGLVVARQRPGTAKGVVFLLIEDEDGDGERHRPAERLRAPPADRAHPSRWCSSTGRSSATRRRAARSTSSCAASPRSTRPICSSDRPRTAVKDFSPLDELERRRIVAEQPLVAVAGGGPIVTRASAAHRRARRRGRRRGGGRAGGRARRRPGTPRSRFGGPGGGGPAGAVGGGGPPGAAFRAGRPGGQADRPRPVDEERRPPDGDDRTSPDGPAEDAHERTGSEDFRAVAPPVMSFAQGRRR